MKFFESVIVLTMLTTLGSGPIVHAENATTPLRTELGLIGLTPDLEFLRHYWLLNHKDQNRPARVLFCVFPSNCVPQVVIRFAPKLFEDVNWQEDFMEIRAAGNYDTNSIFYKNRTFYAQNGLSFKVLTDNVTIPLQPYSTIPCHSLYIEIIYSTLETFTDEIENKLSSLRHGTLAGPVEALLKATFTYGLDKRNVFVENVQLLKAERAYNDLNFKYTIFLESSLHLFLRLDREKKTFFTDKEERLNCTTLIRPIVSFQNTDRKTWRNFFLFSQLMHNIRDVLFALFLLS